MTYKEFKEWLKPDVIDTMAKDDLLICTIALAEVEAQPMEERELFWAENCEAIAVVMVVEPINERIKKKREDR